MIMTNSEPTNASRNESAFRPIVGIDLGTTNSAVAFLRNGQPYIIPSANNERIIPSVILIDPGGKVIVGEDARSSLVAMPDRTIAAVKRRMGSDETIPIAGQKLLPQELSALILKELKSYVDELYGEGDKEAIITVPAYFTDSQRRATKEAGELAGFVVERIINEPTAAALAFGLDHLDEDRTFLVYDLGGGTFDVSVVEMMGGLLEVKASTGNNMLGGEDFDWALVDFLAEHMIGTQGVDPREDIRARALLKDEAEKVKKQLSSARSVSVALPLVTVKDNLPVGLTVEVSREQFVKLIEDKLNETIACVQTVLREAELKPQDIDEVLLVGGSTRIPRIHEIIAEVFGKLPRTDVNPDEAVALGAAVQAGLKSGALSNSGLVATDVAPYSMGIAVLKEGRGLRPKPGGFAPIIERNTTIPVTRTETFYTTAPGQTAVEIKVYQGEHEWVKSNHLLGEFLLDGIPENLNEQEKVEVTFRYNLNGILEVAAKCVSTDKEMNVTMQDGLDRHSRNAFQESAERLESLWNGVEADDDWEDEWDELTPLDLDEDDGDVEYVQPDLDDKQMRLEAERLLVRARELADTSDEAFRSEAGKVILLLQDALADSDTEQLRQAIDDAADLMIELEL